jgi:hypothetical protein
MLVQRRVDQLSKGFILSKLTGKMAGYPMPFAFLFKDRFLLLADRPGNPATWMETTAAWWINRTGNITLQYNPFPFGKRIRIGNSRN